MKAASPEGIPKLQGYNEGFNKAVNTFQEVIILLFAAQIIQLITHRLLYREKPFSITIKHPVTGQKLLRKGSEKQVTGKTRRILKLLNQASFTISLFIAAFLTIQIFFPAYTWEVKTVFN